MPDANKRNFSDDYMPYAPAGPVIALIKRYRDRGLHEVLDLKNLESLSIAPGNAARVQRALEFLGLIDGAAKRTPLFDRLGKATTDEYVGVLAEVVRAAYAPIFAIVNPGLDTDIAVNDAFRPYRPTAQRGRMISFFLGMCQEAGITAGGPVERRPRARREPAVRAEASRPVRAPSTSREPTPTDDIPTPANGTDTPDYRLVAAVVQQLPRDGKWSQQRRDKWIEALTATVDLLVEIEGGGA